MEACPYGAVVLNPEKETVMMCDLCDGEPQCVEWCPEEALALVTQKEFDANLRKATADKLIDHEQGKQSDRKERDDTGFLHEEKNESLNLLVEAFSEPKPIDILVYGIYVKKHLACMVPGSSTAKIEKTLKWLGDAIKVAEKSGKR